MIVKICGIRTLEDAFDAVEAGADMLGFNFHPPSPRFIHPSDAALIAWGVRRRSPHVVLVGVFVNLSVVRVRGILDECRLDAAQLHGDEPAEDLRELGGRAFKAVRVDDAAGARQALEVYSRPAGTSVSRVPSLLLDGKAPGSYGGTGSTATWEVGAMLAAEGGLLLAGGLRPDNVAEAIGCVRPWGVDVASGVESAPGIKDAGKMADFVRAARSVPKLRPLRPAS